MKLADKPTVLKRPRAYRHTYTGYMWLLVSGAQAGYWIEKYLKPWLSLSRAQRDEIKLGYQAKHASLN